MQKLIAILILMLPLAACPAVEPTGRDRSPPVICDFPNRDK